MTVAYMEKKPRDAGGKNGVYAALAGEDRPASGDTHKPFGIRCAASDLETLVAAGMQVTRLLNNNLRPVTADDARALYRRIPLTSERTEKHE